MKQPTLSYKLSFLVGGVAFAVVTYIVGTLIYDVELHLWGREIGATPDLLGAIQRIFPSHFGTLVPWVIGTTGVSIALGYLYDRQVRFRQEAEELKARAEALAVTDGLTLLYNHRYLIEQIALEVKRAQRQSHLFVILFMDIDDFKRYNDTHGHMAGDDVLRLVSLATKATVRETDLVARYGGEEIVVVASGTDRESGIKLAERIRARIEQSCPVTVSIGVASFPDDGVTVNELIGAADNAMYDAKRDGKNRVVVVRKAAPLPDQSLQSEETAKP